MKLNDGNQRGSIRKTKYPNRCNNIHIEVSSLCFSVPCVVTVHVASVCSFNMQHFHKVAFRFFFFWGGGGSKQAEN